MASRYSFNEEAVYLDNNIIIDANPKTFTLLDPGYAKDDKNVYFEDKIIVGADLATFEILTEKDDLNTGIYS